MKKFRLLLLILMTAVDGLQLRMSLATGGGTSYIPNWVFWKPSPIKDSTSDIVVAELGQKLADDVTLRDMLETSLRRAKAAAHHLLKPEVLSKYSEWPTEAEDFIVFAASLANRLPQDTIWGSKEQKEEIVQELTRFFYLLDGVVLDVASKKNRKHADPPKLNDELDIGFLDDYGPSHLELDSRLRDDPGFEAWLDKYMASFGQQIAQVEAGTFTPFFSSIQAPAVSPKDNRLPVSPCNGILDAVHRFISGDSVAPELELPDILNRIELPTLLGKNFSPEFLQDDARLLHFHMPVSINSNRFQSPVAGKIVYRSTTVEIERSDVVIRDGDFATIPSSASGYPFPRAQATIIIDTQGASEGDVGKVALIALGLLQPITLFPEMGQFINKGDDLGTFTFPGANHLLLLFQERAHLKIDAPLGDHKVGDAIAHPRSARALTPQWFLKQGLPFLLLSSIAVYALVDFARYEIQEVVRF